LEKSLYRQAVGILLYIALGSRPDIAYAATTLGCYSSNPDQRQWTAVNHLFRYLKATASKKLALTAQPNSKSSPIVAFADGDLGGEIHTGKSTTGYLLYVLGMVQAHIDLVAARMFSSLARYIWWSKGSQSVVAIP
jgi:hypothetical protein